MNTPWIIGAIVFVLWFSYFEWRAFKYPVSQNTLSRFVWSVGQKWPLSLVLWGMIVGGLSVHFYWNWAPNCMAPGVGG